jgi:predicted RNA polymerase sigma factor
LRSAGLRVQQLAANGGNDPAAVAHFRQALDLTNLKSEKVFLSKRIRDCEERAGRIGCA